MTGKFDLNSTSFVTVFVYSIDFHTYKITCLCYLRLTLAEKTIYLNVFAEDEELRRYVRDNLEHLDTVRVKGSMHHSPFVDATGKKRFVAKIKAESIVRSMNIW